MKNEIKKFEKGGRGFFPAFVNRYMNDDFFSDFFSGDLPATNVTENDKEYKIEVSVPGFEKDKINLEIDNNILKITAKEESNKEEKDGEKVLRREFRSSAFSRSFTLPENIDTENIQASQKDGILQISLPKQDKAPEDKIKKIEIR